MIRTPRKLAGMLAAAVSLAAAPVPVLAAPSAPDAAMAQAPAQGILRIKSANGFDDTVARLKADVAAKGIRLFDVIDQQALGAGVGLKINRSTLVLFGNPPLGVQFLEANPYAGIDWPVRMLVTEDANHNVWLAWTDFGEIQKRYQMANRDAQLKMASEVAASIAAAAASH